MSVLLLVGLKITCLVRLGRVEELEMLSNVAWIRALGECTTLILCCNRFMSGSDIPFPISSSQSANSGLVALMFCVKTKVFWLKAGHRELIWRHASIYLHVCLLAQKCVPLGTIGRVWLQSPPCNNNGPVLWSFLQTVPVLYRGLSKKNLQELIWNYEKRGLYPKWCMRHPV